MTSDPPSETGEGANRHVVGWREFVALPDWGIRRVRAKVDTGARTCAIHVASIELLGEDRVKFQVVFRERPDRRTKWILADLVRESRVKPSSGRVQRRPVVRTRIVIGPIEREVEVSLVCRQGMLCRMLVGRSALAGFFTVDPARSYLTTRGSKGSEGSVPR